MKCKFIIREKWQDLKSDAMNLATSIALLAIFVIFASNPIELKNSFAALQNVSENFFVRCNADDGCMNIILPFLWYVLHSYDSLEKMLTLWTVVSATLTIYLSYEIFKSNANVIQKIKVIVIWSITALGVNYGMVGVEAIPCINCLLISYLKMKDDQNGWESFAFAALLLNLGLGVLFLVILMLILLAQSISKKTRITVIKISRQICLGFGAILVYLSMIDYNFF